jgi:hypothetical protein
VACARAGWLGIKATSRKAEEKVRPMNVVMVFLCAWNARKLNKVSAHLTVQRQQVQGQEQ